MRNTTIYKLHGHWRLKDGLSERDVVQFIIAFKVGAPKWVLAERYGIGMKSVKKILRAHDTRKHSRYDTQGS